MSDDVGQASFIGGSINKGLGSIPTAKAKKKTKEDESPKKTTAAPAADAPVTETPKQTKALPKPKNPSSKKAKVSSSPVFVKSERVNNSTITPTKEITPGQKQLPVGRQFTEYAGLYGTDKQPPVNLTNLK